MCHKAIIQSLAKLERRVTLYLFLKFQTFLFVAWNDFNFKLNDYIISTGSVFAHD